MPAAAFTFRETRHVTEPTSDPILEFYTHHPYPPPVANLDRARDEWRDPNRHRAEYHLLWPERPYRGDLDILVAGCGTWQAAKYALCRPDAHVVGIDISTTSLEHTERLKRQYALSNLELRQLPIEEADGLDRRFDLIVCTGVLHHLADPDAGLRALGSVLQPDGAMQLMLYARYGRIGIDMLQRYCRRLGVGTSSREIGELVAVLKALPQSHPLAAVLRGSRDAGNADALADVLLNPRERSYSVPELFDFMARQDVAFSRWQTQAPYLPQCGALSATSHATRVAALPEREQFAAMELWRGTIATHSFVLRRTGASDDRRAVRFDDERWRRYVPLRLAHTICVEERLPPGAAGVLINRSHPHPDLILPINGHEKRIVDAIDGRRTAAECVERAAGDRDRARRLFEKLWWYDQVVFDTSDAG